MPLTVIFSKSAPGVATAYLLGRTPSILWNMITEGQFERLAYFGNGSRNVPNNKNSRGTYASS